MMATEATANDLAKQSPSPDNELNTTETSNGDVASTQPPLVNGHTADNDKDGGKQDKEHSESAGPPTEASVGTESDPEASKEETSKADDKEAGVARTASTLKKFASFKPVSVNKTFLAAKGASTTAPSKLGEKATTGPSPAPASGSLGTLSARPRLVAKSGSGLQGSATRTPAAASGGKAGTAPDASAVWNKNQPPPPPEVKRFTDEELKQRYGIHLATRLQADEPGGKEKNWADIDDDDDDWAPETIEWTDGTKITLPTVEETPPPPPVPAPAPPQISILKEPKAVEPPESISPAPTSSSSTPIVKQTGLGSGRTGLILKGAAEKPTLVAKPPGPPAPVKSPWQKLAPVDKVSPVAIELPHAQNQQPPPSRFTSQRDPHGFSGMPPPPPAKEIAADDFSRGWRDGETNTSKELYNPQSSRYEPVNDARRNSRPDGHSRQPAVLQRRSHDEAPGPSAAFQTQRTNQDPGYGRRRGSSNVSGGSGPKFEMLNARRGSFAVDDSSSPGFPPNTHQQNHRGHQNQPWQSRPSPNAGHPSSQAVHAQPTPGHASGHADGPSPSPVAALIEDPLQKQNELLKIQEEMMRKGRADAMKRRQELEAKEEAERKERIRIKLEAMGPPPEKKSKKDAVVDPQSVPIHIQTRVETANVAEKAGSAVKDSAIEKPVAVTSVDPAGSSSARLNGVQNTPSSAHHLTADNSRAQPWKNSSASSSGGNDSRFTNNWSAAPQPQPSRTLWGPPNTDRASNERPLGNGSFVADMSSAAAPPGPIGPPTRTTTYQAGRGREQLASRPAPIGPPNRQQQQLLSQSQQGQQPSRAVPARTADQQQKAAAASAVWGSIPNKLQKEDQALRSKQQDDMERAAVADMTEMTQPAFKDTWKQVALNEDGTRTKVNNVLVSISDGKAAGWTAPEDLTARPASDSASAWRSPSGITTSPPVKGSRFFPNKNRDIRLENEEMSMPFGRSSSPSPPPPTMNGHPAYDGDSSHPFVSLPRPAPVVRLPPTLLAPIGPPKPISFAAAVATPAAPATNNMTQGRQEFSSRAPSSYQDIRKTDSSGPVGWQERINNLVRSKNSAHALAVDSSSRTAFEHPAFQMAAVSLPGSVSGDSGDDEMAISKPAAEECFEEQEMGSRPPVRVPKNGPPNGWTLAPFPPKLNKKFVLKDVTTVEAIDFYKPSANQAVTISILFPGQTEEKTVSLPMPRQQSNGRRGGRGGRGGNPSHARGGRGGRDSNNAVPPSGHDVAGPSYPPTRGGHRGNRGFGASPWGGRNSTPINT